MSGAKYCLVPIHEVIIHLASAGIRECKRNGPSAPAVASRGESAFRGL